MMRVVRAWIATSSRAAKPISTQWRPSVGFRSAESIDRCALQPEDIAAPVTLAACPTDQIAPLEAVEELGRRVQNLTALRTLPSLYGHDSFLKEPERVGAILREFLNDD
ncbi:MAG: hypothetical protein M0D54_00755 [Hyphomonadaceae bacterium JAD_PAG50586_4]|nr:MAG: hypothetical protein M0D54_00755 [Hyphomonadaceae bacterium JAD_PAG50586_4]